MPTPTTANRGYQLPHPENELDTDVLRLVSALQSIDTDVASLLISVSQAALGTHGHVIGDVTGLQAALNDKAAAGHTHAINDLTDVDITGAPAGRPLTTQVGGGVGIGPAPMTQAQVDVAIAAAIAALADAAPATLDTLNELAAALGDDPNFAATMTAALAGKASTSHAHTTAEVSGLDAALAGINADVASNTGRIDTLESSTSPRVVAWVNFDGRDGTIRNSHGVSSVTRTATGLYTINLSIVMADTDYAVALGANTMSGSSTICYAALQPYATDTPNPLTTTSVSVQMNSSGGGGSISDAPYFTVSIIA